jgi:4-hydroxy-2-oxoglutarate aldolase
MTKDALKKHYFAVADASPVPVLIYNMPANSGLDMDAETIASFSFHENIIGVKDSGGNVVKMSDIIRLSADGFQVLAGSAGFLLPALSVGAIGGILALANIAPQLCLDIYNSFHEGEMAKAAILQRKAVPVNSAVTSRWGIPALKAAMDHLGNYGGAVRGPLMDISEENRSSLIKILDEYLG